MSDIPSAEQIHESATLVDSLHYFLSDNGVVICVLALIWAVYKGFVAYLEYKKAIQCKRRQTDEDS